MKITTEGREFCKQGSAAALGLLSPPGFCQPDSVEAGSMAGKITRVAGKVIGIKGTCGIPMHDKAVVCYCSFAYSALASFRIGISGSAFFQIAKKSW